MRKYFIKDEDGEEIMVEEVSRESEEPEMTDADEGFTEEEIAALKQLAELAPALTELIQKMKPAGETEEVEGAEEFEEEEEEEPEEGTEEEEEEEEEEEIVDTDSCGRKARDSKLLKSVGSLEKKKAKDSADVEEDAVSDAWTKRYGGK